MAEGKLTAADGGGASRGGISQAGTGQVGIILAGVILVGGVLAEITAPGPVTLRRAPILRSVPVMRPSAPGYCEPALVAVTRPEAVPAAGPRIPSAGGWPSRFL
jgi:hypothetical protein